MCLGARVLERERAELCLWSAHPERAAQVVLGSLRRKSTPAFSQSTGRRHPRASAGTEAGTPLSGR